jgi:hypothetical protein
MRVKIQMIKNVMFLWNCKVCCRPQQSKRILLSKNYVLKVLFIFKTNLNFKEQNLQAKIKKKSQKIFLINSMNCQDPILKNKILHFPKKHLQRKKKRSFTSITSAFKLHKIIMTGFRKETTF